MGKKSTPQAPPAPDPVATARAQTDMNKESAVAQANLNRIDQYTPQGNLTYQTTGTNADGTPRYRQDVTYSPAEQAKYDTANEVALAMNNLAVANIGRVQDVQGTPFTAAGAPNRVTNINSSGYIKNLGDTGDIQDGLDFDSNALMPTQEGLEAAGGRASDSVYNQYKSRLDPMYQQREDDMRARLAAQGITENTDAYRREFDNEGRARTDAYGQAAYQAQQAGSAEQSRLLDLALRTRAQGTGEVAQQGAFKNAAQNQTYEQARDMADLFNGTSTTEFNERGANATLANQGRKDYITEEAYKRNLPLNEIAALLGTGGGVSDPNFSPASQVGVAAPDYQGIVQSNYGTAMNQYNQQMAARSQMMGSIFGALGSLGGAAIMSDRRLKTAIQRVGTLTNGIHTYVFSYLGSVKKHFGVMAQEVVEVMPDAVGTFKDGTMYVNYGKVYA